MKKIYINTIYLKYIYYTILHLTLITNTNMICDIINTYYKNNEQDYINEDILPNLHNFYSLNFIESADDLNNKKHFNRLKNINLRSYDYSFRYYKRKHKEQNHLHKKQDTINKINLNNQIDFSTEKYNDKIIIDEYKSYLNKNTPFIKYLIDKRIGFCCLGSSSHIAAFVPVSLGLRSCFIHCQKCKGRNR